MAVPGGAAASRSPPRALLLPFPAQGHVKPLMDLAHRLVCNHFDVTFVNSEYDNARILAAASLQQATAGRIRVATVPDGLGPTHSRADLAALCDSLLRVGPERLEQLIREEGEAGRPVTCVVADGFMAWAFDVAAKFGLPGVVMWPASAETYALVSSFPNMIQDGIIDEDVGKPINGDTYNLIPGAPPISHSAMWDAVKDPGSRRSMFRYFLAIARFMNNANFFLCNSFLELEHGAFSYVPHILPIGTYHQDNECATAKSGHGSFWAEERDCLCWLDTQPLRSVVYVAFGSLAAIAARQFQELALGLELSGRPFLWVLRPDLVDIDGGSNALCLPSGFQDRIIGRGRTVGWAPQREVLAHPAVACFLTHSGWNSVTEAVRHGVPLLCWPYFLDQIPNTDRACDVWRIALRLLPDGDGLVHRDQIIEKLNTLLLDDGIRERALKLKETVISSLGQGGTSSLNFNRFVVAMRNSFLE